MKPDPRLNHMLSGNTHETLVDLGCMLFHVCSPFAREKAENTMKHLKKHTKGVKHVNIKRNNEKITNTHCATSRRSKVPPSPSFFA